MSRRRPRSRVVGLPLLLGLLGACAPGDPVQEAPSPPCPDPVEGLARFTEEGGLRGLTQRFEPPGFQAEFPSTMGALVAEDLDDDGDIDLMTTRRGATVSLYENHGGGGFTLRPPPALTLPVIQPGFLLGVVDLDDDDLPELFLWDEGVAVMARNLGGLQWGPLELVWLDPGAEERWVPGTWAFGDVDGDGDLDVALAGSHSIPADMDPSQPLPEDWLPDLLLLNRDGDFEPVLELTPRGVASPTQVALFTDRDGDGDQDLLMGVDRGRALEPTAFWRNDGLDGDGVPILVNDAAEIGAELRISAMGVAVADLDGDGALDYCMTDIGPPQCLVTHGGPGYVESGLALGMRATSAPVPEYWSGWSIELADLDNDGDLDAVAAGGDPGPEKGDGQFDPATFGHPNVIWRGEDGTFEDVSVEVGFGGEGDDYGLATADFDGDGWLDIVSFSLDEPPELWMNRCGDGHWLALELRGAPGNSMAFGARVEVVYGDRRQITEVTNLRSRAQGPSRVHVGLGVEESAEVRVVWPDGAVSELSPEIDRVVEVLHPSR